MRLTDMVPDPRTWTASRFDVRIERRADHSLLIIPVAPLPSYPLRVTDRLEEWAARDPARLFVARRDGSGSWRRLSYLETLQAVRTIAAGLLRLGLSAERPLLILSGNSLEHLLLALSALYAGIPYCPVSPAYSQSEDLARLHHVMDLLTPGLVAAFDPPLFERAITTAVPRDAMLLTDAPVSSSHERIDWQALARAAGAQVSAAHASVGPDSIAKFMLTSGSTARPKAVITTHRMLCSNQIMLQAAIPFVREEPPVLVDWLPWNHTFGGSHNVGLVLFNGGSLYLSEGRPTAEGFDETVRNLREISPTIYLDVPKGYEMLVGRMDSDAALRASFFRRLRSCFFAGAALTQHTWDALDRHAMRERGGPIPILSGLGATETAPSATFTTPDSRRAGMIGLPPPGSLIKLAAVGDKLEMRARGPHVTPGYWRDPEQTRAAFDEEGFYRFGDAVRLADPENATRGLIFDGRLAEDFKLSSGTWVSVGPLRANLLSSLAPLVLDLVVAGLNRDCVTALLLLDLEAARQLARSPHASLAELATNAEVLQALKRSLQRHAQAQAGSASRVSRALVLPEPPSAERGEITDKGSLNQRRLLERWQRLVEMLYAEEPGAHVIIVGTDRPDEGAARAETSLRR